MNEQPKNDIHALLRNNDRQRNMTRRSFYQYNQCALSQLRTLFADNIDYKAQKMLHCHITGLNLVCKTVRNYRKSKRNGKKFGVL